MAAAPQLCGLAGCTRQVGTWGLDDGFPSCTYTHYLILSGQDDAVLFPRCQRAGLYMFCIIYAHMSPQALRVYERW